MNKNNTSNKVQVIETVRIEVWDLFLKSPETMRASYFIKLGIILLVLFFFYIENMLKDQLFKTSGLQFDNGLFGIHKFSGPKRFGPYKF